MKALIAANTLVALKDLKSNRLKDSYVEHPDDVKYQVVEKAVLKEGLLYPIRVDKKTMTVTGYTSATQITATVNETLANTTATTDWDEQTISSTCPTRPPLIFVSINIEPYPTTSPSNSATTPKTLFCVEYFFQIFLSFDVRVLVKSGKLIPFSNNHS